MSIFFDLYQSVLSVFTAPDKKLPLPVVPNVSLERYSGTWYEIAKLPNRFEKGLKCITATYTLNPDKTIKVENGGVNIESGERKVSIGKAAVPDPKEPTKLKVSFFWPFSGDYWIIALDEDYKYVMVGHPNRQYLWILCRHKSLDIAIYRNLLEQAKNQGFNIDKVEQTIQDC